MWVLHRLFIIKCSMLKPFSSDKLKNIFAYCLNISWFFDCLLREMQISKYTADVCWRIDIAPTYQVHIFCLLHITNLLSVLLLFFIFILPFRRSDMPCPLCLLCALGIINTRPFNFIFASCARTRSASSNGARNTYSPSPRPFEVIFLWGFLYLFFFQFKI